MATVARNPFPGMNPYLEQRWKSVHGRFVIYLADRLTASLPKGLAADPQERVYIETLEGPDKQYEPDIHVYQTVQAQRKPAPESGSVATLQRQVARPAPMRILVPKLRTVEHYVEITDLRSGGKVVTVIELVSPTNKKPGVGRRSYLRKQATVRKSRANSVEIDLIRGGRPVTSATPDVVPAAGRAMYHAVVQRAADPGALDYYPCPLRNRLPAIAIPLRKEDEDVDVDLQSLIDEVYVQGNYAETLDYSAKLDPPPDDSDAEWIAAILKQAASTGQ